MALEFDCKAPPKLLLLLCDINNHVFVTYRSTNILPGHIPCKLCVLTYIDGLELAAAMTHFHNEDGSKSNPPTLSDDQLSQIVDQVLRDDDLNDDGYVDYYEFVRAQKMDKELAKNEGA